MDPARQSFVKAVMLSVAAGLIAIILYVMALIFLFAGDPNMQAELASSPALYFHVGSGFVFSVVAGLVLTGMLVLRRRKRGPG